MTNFICIFLCLLVLPNVRAATVITSISPTSGSIAGGTRLTIHGSGFSKDQFSYDDPSRGNLVYLSSDQHLLLCDVISYYTSMEKIVCDTRRSPSKEGTYKLIIFVDGVRVTEDNGAYCGGKCTYRYQQGSSPTITSVLPRSGPPGTVVTVRGRIFTSAINNLQASIDDLSKTVEIVRMFFGSTSICDPIDPTTNNLYGAALDSETSSYGYVKCKLQTPMIDSINGSFLVSAFGRSLRSSQSLVVNWDMQLHLFQTHSIVTDVSPSSGSLEGGSRITITGKYLAGYPNKTQVAIADIPCKIESVTSTSIICVTGKSPTNQSTVYAGNRGMLREIWLSQSPSNLHDIYTYTSTDPDYRSEVIPNASMPIVPTFNESIHYSQRFSGFFLPPADDDYTFQIKSDDNSELFLSTTSDPSNKVSVASCPSVCNSWNRHASQKSAKFSLKAGQRYYLEALHKQKSAGAHMQIGVHIHKAPYLDTQTGQAINELQRITQNSVINTEIQTVTINDWDFGTLNEIQVLFVPTCLTGDYFNQVYNNATQQYDSIPYCEYTQRYHLKFGDQQTAKKIHPNASATALATALNGLSSITAIGTVVVTKESKSNGNMYTIEFQSNAGPLSLLSVTTPGYNDSIIVTKKQVGRAPVKFFKLMWGGQATYPLDVDITQVALQFYFDVFFEISCVLWNPSTKDQPLKVAYYHQNYEHNVNYTSGTKVGDILPRCGKRSVKNPSYLFLADKTSDSSGRTNGGYDVQRHRYACFSYKGMIKDSVSFNIEYQDDNGDTFSTWRTYTFTAIQDNNWHDACIDVAEKINGDNRYFSGRASLHTKYIVKAIRVYRLSGDLLIDEVYIGRVKLWVFMARNAPLPNGAIIKKATVTKIKDRKFKIEAKPYHCGHNLGFLKIEGGTIESQDANSRTYRHSGWHGNSSITITRVQSASPPIGGTFSMALEGKTITDIEAAITDTDLKNVIESNFDIGTVNVNRHGSCSAYNWEIKWLTQGGDRPSITVNGSQLTGASPSISSKTLSNGGAFLQPIPGDMLRTATRLSQAVVTVNKIPSLCTGNCSFAYDLSQTPTISGISPTSGAGDVNNLGTEVSISGSGFGTSISLVTVRIGTVTCNVTACTDTSITCRVGLSSGGLRKVEVTVQDKGKARHTVNVPAIAQGVHFLYPISVMGMTPSEGSTGGGTTVTLTGNGFSAIYGETQINLGGVACAVSNVPSNSITSITCVTGKYNLSVPATVTLEVSVIGTSISLSNYYTYKNTGRITSFSPTTGSILGGDLITINGNNFGSSNSLSNPITIGGSPCTVQTYTSTQITCITGKHNRGTAKIALLIEGKGLAVINGNGNYVYLFRVSSIEPRFGSIVGGTEVTIVGQGFSTTESDFVIAIGSSSCKPISSTATKIKCITESSLQSVQIDNSGYNKEFGAGYAWSKPNITISAGTFVKWSWASVPYTTLQYGVMQTNDADSMIYDGSGFISPRSPSGSFTHQFAVPGTYYYSAGNVDGKDLVKMNGKIIVTAAATSISDIAVKTVQGYIARYVNSGENTPVDNTNCLFGDGLHSAITGCSDAKATNTNTSKFEFTWWNCNTPKITSISPKTGTSSTTLVVTGEGFSATTCQNNVTLGKYPCVITSSSTTRIECTPDTQGTMAAGAQLSISILVKNRGYALTTVANPSAKSFTLRPKIQSVIPTVGSIAGGTLVTITGDGFLGDNIEPTVKINSTHTCEIMSKSYTTITCKSPGVSSAASNLRVQVNINTLASSVCEGQCSFSYDASVTPTVVSISPRAFTSGDIITVNGMHFSTNINDIAFKIGEIICPVTAASNNAISCDTKNIVAGNWGISLHITGKGNALFNTSKNVNSQASITAVSPLEGSLEGKTLLTITGGGFGAADKTTVNIGGSSCVIESVTITEIKCRTGAKPEGTYSIIVTSRGISYPQKSFSYKASSTPSVTGISPNAGFAGTSITLTVNGVTAGTSNVAVTIGGVICTVLSSDGSSIVCTASANAAGNHSVEVIASDKGKASGVVKFQYQLGISSISPQNSLLGGGRLVTIAGKSFDKKGTIVKICNSVCKQSTNTMLIESQITCEVPPTDAGADITCDVVVSTNSGQQVTLSSSFTYLLAGSPTVTSISPVRGGTAGGTVITINGSGFTTTLSEMSVSIGGTNCTISTLTSSQIQCTTGAHSTTERALVRIYSSLTNSQGLPSYSTNTTEFYYADFWSSTYTWGGKNPPVEGDYVVINKTQTVVLDVDTPVLKFLLLKGGKLIFDEKDVTLRSEYILITDGGALEVGTEEKPFQHKATIILYGNVRSQELPIYGAKVLAVREGTLDLHGKPIPVTWTRLSSTANAGVTSLELQLAVTWKAGDKIILAATNTSPEENEELTIASVSNGGKTIGLTSALRFKHISIGQTIAGQYVETRAEVGLLTRNVVVRGNKHAEWNDFAEECPVNFDPGQFATQTCFLGRYGNETITDQFGSHIMIAAKEMNKDLVVGRISHVEVTHAGQAFRLGRYPIHYHLNGDVPTSYVRGCSIHHTFNRAVTIHGVHQLTVERNVAYNTMGHSYFLEDGVETGNVIQYNLGIFAKESTSLLNVDITPAVFWITNPNNTVRHNAAAGGTHFGYWFKIPTHPEGPSFTSRICPRKVIIGQFFNNSAHSFGRYGLWIWPTYHPKVDGRCNSEVDTPAKLEKFLAYRNFKGAEGVDMGAVQFHNFTVLDNIERGLETQSVFGEWGEQGPLVKNLLSVGHSQVQGAQFVCQNVGLRTPASSRLTVKNATFVNYDSACTALAACSFCKKNQGGFPTKFEQITYINSPNRVRFNHPHECIYEDIDGTLTGSTAGSSYVPWNNNLPPSNCVKGESEISGGIIGGRCDESVVIRRLSWNKAQPSSLLYKDAILTNRYGTSKSVYLKKRLTHPKGWMITLVMGEDYNMYWQNASHVTNISYHASFYELMPDDFVYINHNLTQIPDFFTTTNKVMNMSDGIPDPTISENGEWFFNRTIKTFYYISKGNELVQQLYKSDLNPNVYQCYFKDCIKPVPKPPPRERPTNYRLWSEKASWNGNTNKAIPKEGEAIVIEQDWWMVLDVSDLPYFSKITIYGVLEFDDNSDKILNTTAIFIHGGQLIIGWENNPFKSKAHILLNGDHHTPEIVLPNGPVVGAKAIGVFGYLDMHGTATSTTWTNLAQTASAGINQIVLENSVDWALDDEIIITSTTYEPYQTEKAQISHISDDKKTITLYGPLTYTHLSTSHTAGGRQYSMKAEVGLLTRNIVIEGAESITGSLSQQSFGARVLVGSFQQKDGTRFTGNARVEYVQFKHTGQDGYKDYYDPRFSIAFLDIGFVPALNRFFSYVRGCSFHDGFNTAIGVFGTSNMTISDNVIYHTVGSSVRVWGKKNRVIRNLAALMVAPATYKGRYEVENLEWEASFDVYKSIDLTLRDNVAAGSQRAGFRIKGEKCFNVDAANSWSNNIAHSNLHGVTIGFNDAEPECARISDFVCFRNYDYGIFFYQSSRIIMHNVTLIDNVCGVMPFVYAPPSVSHLTANKFVWLQQSLIVGTSPSFDCSADNITPRDTGITGKHRCPKPASGGRGGFFMTSFVSGTNMAPKKKWHGVKNYPAINGITDISSTIFSNFDVTCGKRDVVISTNKETPDAIHPLQISAITLDNVNQQSKLYYYPPSIGWVNPSDCVDMDCDGQKHALIRDLDGSFLGVAGSTAIGKAEFEWDGDPRRGLGDYRIPKTFLTALNGSRIPVDTVAPHKGIVRGNYTHSGCNWISQWNAYTCSGLDHEMFIIESMDGDTETRRLSPVALAADGYIDLLNGPQDFGWCHGYTCQERLSTFFSTVSTGKRYDVHFTGTNPQHLRLHLINSNYNQAIVVGIWYANPQRLDVYQRGVYVNPTNVKLNGDSIEYLNKDPGKPDDQFIPTFNGVNGLNYYDRNRQTLYILVRGSIPIDIRTSAVIQVSIKMPAVTIDDFFEKNLINNIAALLSIDKAKIRFVKVISEQSARRRKRATGIMSVILEIGDPPSPTAQYIRDEVYTANDTTNANATILFPAPTTTTPAPNPTTLPQNYTGVSQTTSFTELKEIANKVVEIAQVGSLAKKGYNVLEITIIDPTAPPTDPRSEIPYPNGTDSPNGTVLYEELQESLAANRTTFNSSYTYLIPGRLAVVMEPSGSNETISFPIQPSLAMLDLNNGVISQLGHRFSYNPWKVTAFIKSGYGDPNAYIGGEVTIPFTSGYTNFTNLSISHNGTYILCFSVSYPTEANFTVCSSEIEIKERIFYMTVNQQPNDANETVAFGVQPIVEIFDAANHARITNLGWKGRKWYMQASVNNETLPGKVGGQSKLDLIASAENGLAKYKNLSIHFAAKNYRIKFVIITEPVSSYTSLSIISSAFEVKERILYLSVIQQPRNCNETVPCVRQPILGIRDTVSDQIVDNIGWRGRTWHVTAYLQGNISSSLYRQRKVQVPATGVIQFTELSVYDVGKRFSLYFNVSLNEHSDMYTGMSVQSQTFDVKPREFYLHMLVQPGNANESTIFGQQPVVEVRDVGTQKIATPLKEPWYVHVEIIRNPWPLSVPVLLNGVNNVTVVNEQAQFQDLLITKYGKNYRLKFTSTPPKKVVKSDLFDVYYVNNHSPVFNSFNNLYTASLSEDSKIGHYVVTVFATDKDTGPQGDVYYKIVNGNFNDTFVIDNTTGRIKTDGLLDRETTPIINLTVTAYDGAVPEKVRSTNATVMITLLDINDNSPYFVHNPTFGIAKEDMTIESIAMVIDVRDPDAGENGTLNFTMLSCDKCGYFKLNSSSGALIVNRSLELENSTTLTPYENFTFVIHVTDLGKPHSRATNGTVIVTLEPTNEYPPVFARNNVSVSMSENAAVNQNVAILTAHDADIGHHGIVDFSIESGNFRNTFKIGKRSGKISLVKPLDYETYPSYRLIILAQNGNDTKKVARAIVHITVTDIQDTNGDKISIENVFTRITPLNSVASFAGIPTSSPIKVILTSRTGKKTDMTNNSRTIYDIETVDNALTISKQKDQVMIQAKRPTLKKMKVRVLNVGVVDVPLVAVDYNDLILEAMLYPNVTTSVVNKLYVVGRSGRHEKAVVQAKLRLTDGYIVNVTDNTNMIYSISQNSTANVTIGGSDRPYNVLVVRQGNSVGDAVISGSFTPRLSKTLTLSVTNEMINISAILSVTVVLPNNTLRGVAQQATAKAEVVLLMTNGDKLLINNFVYYSNLIKFSITDPAYASVNRLTGKITLRADHYNPVILTANSIDKPSLHSSISFYCNVEPGFGGVDLGALTGPALNQYPKGQQVHIDVYINRGFVKLAAVNLLITFNANRVTVIRFTSSFSNDLVFVLNTTTIRIGGLINTVDNSTGSMYKIGHITVEMMETGIPIINGRTIEAIDNTLKSLIPAGPSLTRCLVKPMGDANEDCVFNIMDAAHIKIMSSRTLLSTSHDYDKNGVIDYTDALMLVKIFYDLARFVNKISMVVPANASNCKLEIAVELLNSVSAPINDHNTKVYLALTYGDRTIVDFTLKSTFEAGNLVPISMVTGKSIYGRVIQTLPSTNGKYIVTATTSEVMGKTGVSLFQAIDQANGMSGSTEITAFYGTKLPYTYKGAVNVRLNKNLNVTFAKGFSPMMYFDIYSSTYLCYNPITTKRITWRFENDYDRIVKNKEAQFIDFITTTINTKYSKIQCSAFRVSKGSIIVRFNATAPIDQLNVSLVMMYDDLQAGISINYNDHVLKTAKEMLVDGEAYHGANGAPPGMSGGTMAGMLIGICLGVTIIIIGIYIMYKQKTRATLNRKIVSTDLPMVSDAIRSKISWDGPFGNDNNGMQVGEKQPDKKATIDVTIEQPLAKEPLPQIGIQGQPLQRSAALLPIPEENNTSRTSTKDRRLSATSSQRSRATSIVSLPPGYMNEIETMDGVEEKIVKLKRTNGAFNKIGEIKIIPNEYTLGNIRAVIMKMYTNELKGIEFIFISEKLEDIHPAREKKTIGNDIFQDEVIFIKELRLLSKNTMDSCTCGSPAKFECCRRQAYCSIKCQKLDWPFHRANCRKLMLPKH